VNVSTGGDGEQSHGGSGTADSDAQQGYRTCGVHQVRCNNVRYESRGWRRLTGSDQDRRRSRTATEFDVRLLVADDHRASRVETQLMGRLSQQPLATLAAVASGFGDMGTKINFDYASNLTSIAPPAGSGAAQSYTSTNTITSGSYDANGSPTVLGTNT